jgi:uncharacterized repeat protein (TIGR03806 family)
MVSVEDGAVVPRSGVTPYDLNTPLFSDYAVKYRTAWLPPGTSVRYAASDRFDFPVGTVLTKSFGYPADLRVSGAPVKWVETRIMVRSKGGWKGTSYVWNDAQTEATISVGGEIVSPTFLDAEGNTQVPNYLIPSQTQCHKCHDDSGTMLTLGPSAEQLNRTFPYATGRENEIAHWSRVGILHGAPSPAAAPTLPVWSDPSTGDVNARARAYLQANCSYCHDGAGGEARPSGLVLLGTTTNPTDLGICKAQVAAGPVGLTLDIVPGHPEQSLLVARVATTQPHFAMPELGRSLEHTEGVALLTQWISAMPGSCP